MHAHSEYHKNPYLLLDESSPYRGIVSMHLESFGVKYPVDCSICFS